MQLQQLVTQHRRLQAVLAEGAGDVDDEVTVSCRARDNALQKLLEGVTVAREAELIRVSVCQVLPAVCCHMSTTYYVMCSCITGWDGLLGCS